MNALESFTGRGLEKLESEMLSFSRDYRRIG
jgi:hypothetical protein